MNVLGPTRSPRLNEVCGVVLLFSVVSLTLSLISYHPRDVSWNTAAGAVEVHNLLGSAGAHVADLLWQSLGASAFLAPLLLTALAWKWIRSAPVPAPGVRIFGCLLLTLSASSILGLARDYRFFDNSIPLGGMIGMLLADALVAGLNMTGTLLLAATSMVVSLYLISSFSVFLVPGWLSAPMRFVSRARQSLRNWIAQHKRRRAERPARVSQQPVKEAATHFEGYTEAEGDGDIPIRTLDDLQVRPGPASPPEPSMETEPEPALVEYEPPPPFVPHQRHPDSQPMPATRPQPVAYRLPSTELLNEPDPRSPYDAQELKEIAVRIKSKFEEFNVLGNVVQINPGPVVTTFEYKPEAGIKYSRITTLTEDLCLGLQAESILIERIPGKPTVGIEVPNSRRELISLRQVLESEEFTNSNSRMTISLGKDISGRIKVTALEAMPHLLIAGSTGSGKSVMLNSLIMSVLFKATPNDVRMILIDPKRVEMGMYEGVPHLLTPVITDPRKATIALRNAVLEMERRLKLLASQGVRNIDQFNRKVRNKLNQPRNLFDEDEQAVEELQPLPWILIVIDELADLMMIERANVEESITRLAQMARAVGMHLVVATQRPSVDVITGLIKANFPARISFRVATRVDSRTILDVMGAEHLLGRGDMLHMPPGSSRLTRVHAAYVNEAEINQVVDFWKEQARPEYDQSFLIAPPSDEEESGEPSDFDGEQDPLYEDAVRVVLEVGKASTSILQRRLRLGYGRAARILDMMQHEGIIGPPDGSRPREVLKRPEWLQEVEDQLR
jgi:S-DNA-T family DNA segregation ATPase FtsK/SpoIIIE